MNIVVFNFQQMMQTVLNAMAGNVIPSVQTVAYVLMVICLMIGIYEAFANGGDTRQLAATVFKYVVVAFIVGNWITFFEDVMSGFNGIAQFIGNSFGGQDLIVVWQQQLSNNWQMSGYTSVWNIIVNGGAAIINSLEIAFAYIIFPLSAQIFSLIYVFWGAVVFAIGPLVLALAPSRMVNSVAKFYTQNLIVWNCWTIVYSVFVCLVTAIDGMNTSSSPFFSQSVPGAQPQIWIGLTSILYGICLLLIPVISFFVLRADFVAVGGAMFGVIATAATQGSRLMALPTSRQGGSGYGRQQSNMQGGSGGATYRNLSRPPDDTPPRSSVA
jgi:hypothetical protein